MNFMRLSLKKAAHATVGGAAYRKSGHLACILRDVGYLEAQPLTPQDDSMPKKGKDRAVESHISRNTSEMWGTRRLVTGENPQ
jgi:hypothetical protein